MTANNTAASLVKGFIDQPPLAPARWRAEGMLRLRRRRCNVSKSEIINIIRETEFGGRDMPGKKESTSDSFENATNSALDTFDHVVVLMLENRSFDNLLGFIYPDGVPSPPPAGTSFAGASLAMWNPVPPSAVHQPPDGSGKVFVTTTKDYHQPYPDPGEEYYHINVQLWDQPNGGTSWPYNLPPAPLPAPGMQGFVTDYIEKLG